MVTIQIVNWRNYVARGDLKNVNWIRLNANLPFDHKLHSLPADQKWGWILLLTEGARQNQEGLIEVDIDCLAEIGKLNKKSLHALLQHLEMVELIEIRVKSVRVRAEKKSQSHEDVRYITNVTEHNGTEHNITPETKSSARKRQPKESDHIYDLTDSELDLGRKWLEMAVSEMPHKASDPKWHAAQFGEDLKGVAKAIGFTHEQMADVFTFVSSSEFWRPNACSPKQLLKKNDAGMRKIDTIISRMKSPGERKREIAHEAINDPDRPTSPGGLSINKLFAMQGLPPLKQRGE